MKKNIIMVPHLMHSNRENSDLWSIHCCTDEGFIESKMKYINLIHLPQAQKVKINPNIYVLF